MDLFAILVQSPQHPAGGRGKGRVFILRRQQIIRHGNLPASIRLNSGVGGSSITI